jgi:transcriptional regulator with XRE-family HTH domain
VADDDQPALPDDTEQRFAANLRLFRERQSMSQVKLAREMAVRGWPWRQQTVTRVENGQRKIRFGEATTLAEILRTPLQRFSRPVSEANVVEKIRAAGTRLRESCEAVEAAVCHLLNAQRTAERLQVLNAGVQGDDYVEVALVQLRGWMRECTVDRAVLKGRRRFTKLGEKRSGEEGEEGGAAGPAPENAREPMATSADEGEIVNAPGLAGRA